MNSVDLIHEYMNKSKSNDINEQYAALLFALQIPSICARIEIPDIPENCGKSEDGKFYNKDKEPYDGKLYRTWIERHACAFIDYYYPCVSVQELSKCIYNLRCQLTHTGHVLNGKTKIVFVHETQSAMYVSGTFFMNITDFCERIFSIAESVFNSNNQTFTPVADLCLDDNQYSRLRSDLEQKYKVF